MTIGVIFIGTVLGKCNNIAFTIAIPYPSLEGFGKGLRFVILCRKTKNTTIPQPKKEKRAYPSRKALGMAPEGGQYGLTLMLFDWK